MKTTRETVAELMAGTDVGGAEEPDEIAEPAAGEVEQEESVTEPIEPGDEITEEPEKPEARVGERPRASDGKFAKAPKTKPEVKPAGAPLAAAPVQPPAPAPVPAAPELKPPADWTPKAKEKWKLVPREAQEEALRLHVETKKVLEQAAAHRQAAEGWQRALAPYEHMFRAAGKNPVEGVGWLVQQYAALQTAPMSQRAQIVAGLVRDFIGVDEASINLLASALEGKGGSAPATPAALRPEQVQQMVREEAQRMHGESARSAELKAIQDFEANPPEFLHNVTKEIAALVAVERAQGKPVTIDLLKGAYDQAIRMNKDTAAILKQRDDAAAAEKRKAEEAKRKAASSGIRNEPAGPGAPLKATSTRDEVKRQFEKARGGAQV